MKRQKIIKRLLRVQKTYITAAECCLNYQQNDRAEFWTGKAETLDYALDLLVGK